MTQRKDIFWGKCIREIKGNKSKSDWFGDCKGVYGSPDPLSHSTDEKTDEKDVQLLEELASEPILILILVFFSLRFI